jgi:protein-tyrosine phosphatase
MGEAMQTRVLPFDGIHNFRDYGGYATSHGGHVVSGRLYRSGQHVGASSGDLSLVAALKLKTVIDLRGNSERAAYPCARPAGFDATVLFFDGETAGRGSAPHVAAARDIATPADAQAAMIALYDFMPFRPNLVAIFRQYFDALANREGASLLHCFAGKDRTGVAAALVHHVLGVHADDIIADYLLTNTAGDVEARIAAGAESIRRNKGAHLDDATVRTLMEVDPAYLDAARGAMIGQHGSIDSYLEAVLGVTAKMRQSIVQRFVV